MPTIQADTPQQLGRIALTMIEVEHPSLDLENARLDDGVFSIPTVVTDTEPLLEWVEGVPEEDAHALWAYPRRSARLLVYNVQVLNVTPSERNELLDISYDHNAVLIEGANQALLVEARVTGLHVELETADTVCGVTFVHELPGGGQILSHNVQAMREAFETYGITPPSLGVPLED